MHSVYLARLVWLLLGAKINVKVGIFVVNDHKEATKDNVCSNGTTPNAVIDRV